MAVPQPLRLSFAPDEPLFGDSLLDVCGSEVRKLYGYWNRCRGERRMPRRGDIDPSEIPRHLPGVTLVDVRGKPPRFIYRLVGTREVRQRGNDPTGLEVAKAFFGRSQAHVLALYRRVAGDGVCAYEVEEQWSCSGRWMCNEVLFLPLSEDDRQVSQILVYAHPRGAR